MAISNEQLAEWERLASEAEQTHFYAYNEKEYTCKTKQLENILELIECQRKDADFFAAARKAIPALIAEVRRLEEENICLRKKVQWYTDNAPFYDDAHTDERVAQLEKQLDWLVEKLTSSFCLSRQVKYKKMCKGCELYDFGSPIEGETRGMMSSHREQAKKCWRESARKATESE